MARTDFNTDRSTVEVRLSERNLLTLLSKLYTEGSARTITNNDTYVDGEPANNFELILIAESDKEHYGARLDPPGVMHPVTEVLVRALNEVKASL